MVGVRPKTATVYVGTCKHHKAHLVSEQANKEVTNDVSCFLFVPPQCAVENLA